MNVSRVDLGINSRQRRDVRRIAAPERLRHRACACVLRAAGAGARVRARRHQRGGVDGAAARRQQLGQRRQRPGLPSGPDTDTHSNFNQIGPGYLPHARHPADGRTRVHRRRHAPAAPKVVDRQRGVREEVQPRARRGRQAHVDAAEQQARHGDRRRRAEREVQRSARQRLPPVFFTPYRQSERLGSMYFYARTRAAIPAQAAPARRRR